jgi:hypothetical protein
VDGDIVGALLTLALIGFVADVNSGAIVGSVFAVRSGWGPGLAFLGGASGVRIIQGLFGLGVLYAIVDTFLGVFKLDATTYALMALAGLAIVLAGLRQVLGWGDTADAAKPKDADEAGTISTKVALTTGIGINIISLRQWIFTSLAVSTIGTARAGAAISLALFVAYLVFSSWLAAGLLILKLVRPDAAPDVMDRIAAWTDKHLATIVAWGAIVVGVLLLGFGLYRWLG